MYPEQKYDQRIRQKDSLCHVYISRPFFLPPQSARFKGRSQTVGTIHLGTVNKGNLLVTDLPSVLAAYFLGVLR